MNIEKLKELYKAADSEGRANLRDACEGDEGLMKALDSIDEDEDGEEYDDEEENEGLEKSLRALSNTVAESIVSRLDTESAVNVQRTKHDDEDGFQRSLFDDHEGNGGSEVDLTESFNALNAELGEQRAQLARQTKAINGLAKSLEAVIGLNKALAEHVAKNAPTKGYTKHAVRSAVKAELAEAGFSEAAGLLKSLSASRVGRGVTAQHQVLSDGNASAGAGVDIHSRLNEGFQKALAGRNDALARAIVDCQKAFRNGSGDVSMAQDLIRRANDASLGGN